jgi:hypothetical protein
MNEDRAARRREARASVSPAVYVRKLRRDVATRRSELAAAEARIERVRAESAERVAEMTARVAELEERALAAEATLAEALA